jgi:hypothetical protein
MLSNDKGTFQVEGCRTKSVRKQFISRVASHDKCVRVCLPSPMLLAALLSSLPSTHCDCQKTETFHYGNWRRIVMKSVVFWVITRCPEMSVNNYMKPCNYPEDHRVHQHHGRSLKSRIVMNIRINVYYATYLMLQILDTVRQTLKVRISDAESASSRFRFLSETAGHSQTASFNLWMLEGVHTKNLDRRHVICGTKVKYFKYTQNIGT